MTALKLMVVYQRRRMAGIFQFFAMLRKASQINFVAASSFGKWPRFLITLRICIFRLLMALVVYMIRRTSSG